MHMSWLRLIVTLGLLSWAAPLAVQAEAVSSRLLITGFDASSVAEFEQKGVVYKERGQPKDIFRILADAGYTHVRLRVWVDPTKQGHCGEAEVLALAKRAKAAGLKILLCFHYSDDWADPKHQALPPAWRALPAEQLNAALLEHNRRIVAALEAQGTPADMAQIGNEINHGMLWPAGRNNDAAGWDKLAELLKSAVNGIRQGEAQPGRMPIMIHIAGGSVDFFQQLEKRQVPYDIVWLSYYPQWHGSPAEFSGVLNDHARRLKKPVMMVETSYPWTKARPPGASSVPADTKLPPASLRLQAEFLAQVVRVVKAVPDGRGAGVFYWGGERTDGYGNQALVDFQGNALATLPVLATGVIPKELPADQ